ncbi:toxin-antitoxin system YwqK family antitoxin [Ancylomarina salipaludis]|nr:toxin-antitoxin system YwqK family antitoxin [Ancylomarina salipaludis]
MKNRLGLILCFCICMLCMQSFSQSIKEIEGLYYSVEGDLYTGTYTEFYENGNKRIEMNLTEGKRDGKITLFFQDEQIQEVRSYVKGLMDGTWVTWNNQSVKIAEARYKKNKKHGKWYIWDANGVKRYEMEYNEGEKSGTWLIWDEEGKLIKERTF